MVLLATSILAKDVLRVERDELAMVTTGRMEMHLGWSLLWKRCPQQNVPQSIQKWRGKQKKIMRLWMLRLPLLQSYLFRKLVRYSIFQYFLSMLVCIKGWKDEKDLVQGKGSLGDGCNCIPVMEGVHGKKGGNKRLWWWTCWLERFISINASPGKHVSFRTFLHFWSEKNLPKKIRMPVPIPSMYGIFTNIYHKNQPNVGKYTSPMDGMGPEVCKRQFGIQSCCPLGCPFFVLWDESVLRIPWASKIPNVMSEALTVIMSDALTVRGPSIVLVELYNYNLKYT